MSFVNIAVHAVWGTKNRQPVISDEVRIQLCDHIKENAKKKNIYIDTINGHTDHLHALMHPKAQFTPCQVPHAEAGVINPFRFNRLMAPILFYPAGFDVLSKKFLDMKTKLILLTIFAFAYTITGYAQTSDAEADAIINLLGVQKREAVGKLVALTDKDTAAFWKVYDEYQKLNKANAKARIGLYEQTAHTYGHMTAQAADSLANRYFNNRIEQEKMLETYYKKMKAATNSVVAFQFYQAEVYLLTQIRAQIMQQIPTYGQLVLAAKNK